MSLAIDEPGMSESPNHPDDRSGRMLRAYSRDYQVGEPSCLLREVSHLHPAPAYTFAAQPTEVTTRAAGESKYSLHKPGSD